MKRRRQHPNAITHTELYSISSTHFDDVFPSVCDSSTLRLHPHQSVWPIRKCLISVGCRLHRISRNQTRFSLSNSLIIRGRFVYLYSLMMRFFPRYFMGIVAAISDCYKLHFIRTRAIKDSRWRIADWLPMSTAIVI